MRLRPALNEGAINNKIEIKKLYGNKTSFLLNRIRLYGFDKLQNQSFETLTHPSNWDV